MRAYSLRRVRLLVIAGLCFMACREAPTQDLAAPAAPLRSAAPPSVASSAPAPSIATASATALPPLGGEWLVKLPIEGFGDAVVSVPLGATEPRPVMIGVHGRGDRPEWACGEWRGVSEARPFILCPHGTPVNAAPGQGLAFAGSERLREEIDRGLAALRARFDRYVAEGPMIYAGFSLGAILGVAIVADDPARFPVVVLGEGGYDKWTPDRAQRFARGGKRVLFICSTGGCEAQSRAPIATLRRAGVEAKMISAGRIGHLVDDRVVAAARAAWPWVLGEAAPR